MVRKTAVSVAHDNAADLLAAKQAELTYQLRAAVASLAQVQSMAQQSRNKLEPQVQRLQHLQSYESVAEGVEIDGLTMSANARQLEVSRLMMEIRVSQRSVADVDSHVQFAENQIRELQQQLGRIQQLGAAATTAGMSTSAGSVSALTIVPGKAGSSYTGLDESESENQTKAQKIETIRNTWKTLTQIDIVKRQCTDVEGTALVQEMSYPRSTITTLRLNKNKLEGDTVASLFTALAANQSMVQLSVRNNNINDSILAKIVQPLISNVVLVALSLNDNAIGNTGCKYLADVLRKNRSLEDISLRNNQIGDLGGEVLADALKVNPSMKKLALYDNPSMTNGKKLQKQVMKYSACQLIVSAPSF